jgi:hypothetical protein
MILESSNFEIVIQRRSHTETYAILGFLKIETKVEIALCYIPIYLSSSSTFNSYERKLC